MHISYIQYLHIILIIYLVIYVFKIGYVCNIHIEFTLIK